MIEETLAQLRAERARLDKVIAALEQLDAPAPRSKRGRKFMPAEERQRVSSRIKAYWEKQRGKQ